MRNRRTPVLATLLLFSLSVAVRADHVDDYIKAEMQKQRIPGLSLAVVKEGKVIKAQGYGLANVELNVAATPDTVYKIGSISKQFIATAIMVLAEEGKLGLGDPVVRFLDGSPDSWKGITIRHLLTHTSGIVREAPGFHPFKVQPDIEVIKTAYALPLRFAPGEKWEYCNVGYFALAEIIHKVTGKEWGEYLKERVFIPSGMAATRRTDAKEIVPNRASGYEWQGEKLLNSDNYLATRPSGAFLSTILDLAKWEAVLYAGKVLKPSTLEQMWKPVQLSNGASHPYGFGWEMGELNGLKHIRHGGTLSGFRAEYMRLVDSKVTLIVLTNSQSARPDVIAKGVAAFYLHGPAQSIVK